MIKNIVFDFGGVLVDFDFIPIVNSFFAPGDEKRRDEFCRIYLSQEFMNMCDLELKPFADIIADEKSKHPEFASELDMFRNRYQEFIIGEMPGMPELLGDLKKRGFRLYGLSNWCSEVYKVMERHPIFRRLDGYVISSEEHLIKPDTAIYTRLCDKYSLLPEECLFADDKAVNVEGAQKAGMHGVVFTSAAELDRHIQNVCG